MHLNGMFYALIYIINHIFSCIICMLSTSLMEARPQFWHTLYPLFVDANNYQRLLGKLIYITDIVYMVSVLSHFVQEPRRVHWEGALRVLTYIKRAQEEGSSINDTIISISKPTLTSGMQVIREIVNLLQAIKITLEVTSSPGDPWNRWWYHAPLQSSSIELWWRPHERWYGFDHFSKISTFHLLFKCPCIVIIKLLSSSPTIPLFMSIQSTLRLTATTYKIRLCPESSPLLMWHHIITLRMSSHRVQPGSHMTPRVTSWACLIYMLQLEGECPMVVLGSQTI